MADNQCYMCSDPSTSREHAPPKCMFPEGHRENLITVPSCDAHNTAKSKDDEWLRTVLTMNYSTNKTGTEYGFQKIKSAYERKPKLLTALFETARPTMAIDGTSMSVMPTVEIEIDSKRALVALERIGRALYFHHFGHRAPAQVIVEPYFLRTQHEEHEKQRHDLEMQSFALFANVAEQGANPRIFTYQIARGAETIGIRMQFYGQNHVVIVFKQTDEGEPVPTTAATSE